MAREPPFVTWTLAAAILAFAWFVTGLFPRPDVLLAVAWSPRALAEGDWTRMVTSILAHGNLVHLATNLLALLTLGAAVERALGPLRYAALFAIAGIAGNLAQSAVSTMPVVGASGAIFGLVGVLLVLVPAERLLLFGIVPVSVVVLTAFYTALVVAVPAFSRALPIAHAAHLGGMGAGLVAGALTNPRRALANAPGVVLIFAVALGLVTWWLSIERASLDVVLAREGWLGLALRFWPALAGGAVIALALGHLERGDRDADATSR